MGVKYNNNASTLLTNAIDNSQTTFDVDSVASLPSLGASDHMYLTITDPTGLTVKEIVKVTGISTLTLTVVRGVDGTSGTACDAGDKIELRLCSAMLSDAFAESVDGRRWHTNVLVSTTANITLSGEQTLDGILTSTSRVLVRHQTNTYENGIYDSAAGAWTRVTDMDTWDEVPSAAVAVSEGTLYADTMWLCTSDAGGVLDTTAITWVNFDIPGDGTVTSAKLSGNLTLPGTLDLGGTLNGVDNELNRVLFKDVACVVNDIGSTGGGTQDIDLTLGNVHKLTVDTSANTFTFSNPSPTGNECTFMMIVTNGGSQTVTWPASVDWPSGTAPTLTTSGRDRLVFTSNDAGTTWDGKLVMTDMQ